MTVINDVKTALAELKSDRQALGPPNLKEKVSYVKRKINSNPKDYQALKNNNWPLLLRINCTVKG